VVPCLFRERADYLGLEKSSHKRGVASFEGENLVLFYYLNASEIWPDKRETTVPSTV
jgi:hypothetical protein